MSIEAQFLLSLFAVAMTVSCGFIGYLLIEAKATIARMEGFIEKNSVGAWNEAARKAIGEADAIVASAEAKVKTAQKRAVTQRKIVSGTSKK